MRSFRHEASGFAFKKALQAAIEASCVHEEFRGNFPKRAWAYVNGVLHRGATLQSSER